MPSYKLTYFDFTGRAESIRLIFAAAKVPFTDERIGGPKWQEKKPSLVWGQLPVLEVDGKILAQSLTINRYLGRVFNLYGNNEWDAAKCDEYVDAVMDVADVHAKFYFSKDEEVKKTAKQELVETRFPKLLGRLEKIKKENGGDYLICNKLTWADIFIAEKFDWFEKGMGDDLLNNYPGLKKFKAHIYGLPGIQAYHKK